MHFLRAEYNFSLKHELKFLKKRTNPNKSVKNSSGVMSKMPMHCIAERSTAKQPGMACS